MEAEERPSKLRKLSHDQSKNGNVLVLPQAQSESTPDAEVETNDTKADADADTRPGNSIAKVFGLKSALDAQMDRTSDAEGQPAEPVLSKNQLKKLKRKADWEAGREDRKLKRKEKTKEKKARKRALKEDEAAEQKPDDRKKADLRGDHIPPKNSKAGLPPRKRRQRLPVSFVIDCGFDDLMVEKEIMSLGSQITRAYSDNSKAPFQAHLYVSGWTAESELRKRFEGLLKGMYKNWRGVVFTEQDFVAAASMAEIEMSGKYGGRMVGAFGRYAPAKDAQANAADVSIGGQGAEVGGMEDSSEVVAVQALNDETTAEAAPEYHTNSTGSITGFSTAALQDAGEVIYLTSDSPHTLTELKPYHTYVIGGLVDKNRHKGICYKTALDKNAELTSRAMEVSISTNDTNDPAATLIARRKEIKTAKLPIGEYMSMTARHVLATNHVVEIMLRWLETRDWGQAFLSVMPKRKGGVLRNIKSEDDDEDDGSTTLEGKDEENDHVAQQEALDAAALADADDSEQEPSL